MIGAARGPVMASALIAAPEMAVGSVFVNPGVSDVTTVTGLTFTPRVVLFITGPRAAGVADLRFGWAQVGATGGVYFTSTDGGAASQVASDYFNTPSLISATTTGFSIQWGNPGTDSFTCSYLAVGGFGVESAIYNYLLATDLSNINAPSAPGFTPAVALNALATADALAGTVGFGLGAATTVADQWGLGLTSSNNDATTDLARQLTTQIVSVPSINTASLATLNRDTWQLTQSVAEFNARSTMLLLGKVSAKTAAITKRSGTGTQAVTGVGFRPKAVIFTSIATPTADTPFTLGFGTASSNVSSSLFLTSGAVDTVSLDSATASISLLSNAAGTVRAEAAVQSLDADGFTLNWTTNDAAADTIRYVALG